MSDSPRRSRCRTTGTLLAALVAFAVLPSQSAAATHSRAPSAATPVNPTTISDSLTRQTGYSASQLSTKPVCGTPKPGRMSCLARILVVKQTGKPATLLSRPLGESMRVVPTANRKTDPLLPAAAGPDDNPGLPAPQKYTPAYLQWAYDLSALAQTGGTGDTVAIVDGFDDPNAAADLATFRQNYRIWPCVSTASAAACQTVINGDGFFQQYNQAGQPIDQSGDTGTPPVTESSSNEPDDPNPGGWEVEESLDVDAVTSLCNHCTIALVEASPGTCSPVRGQCTYPSFDANLETAAKTAAATPINANQISMSFGEYDTPGSGPSGPWSFPGVASLAAAGDSGYPGSGYASYPAAYSDVTAVGGTSLSPADNARGFGESVWNSDGGATGSGCDTSQSVPSYQTGVTTQCPGRAYNDVSADADPNTGLNVYDTFGGSAGFTGWEPVGGTSLATPLTAAYEAVAGITPTPSPAWAYSDAALLNDIVSGSDGTCPAGALLICNAGTGWDGPTGNGSISGDVAVGGPGVGGSYASYVNSTDVTLTGGLYPNSAATTYQWQYGGDTTYSSPPTALTSVGSGATLQPVSNAICNLSPGTTYHFRLVANNTYGGGATAYGFDNTFTTAASESPPSTSAAPTVSGTAAVSQTLSAQSGTWNDQSCNSAPSYRWQESNGAASGFSDIGGATSATYSPTDADAGMYIRVAISETNLGGAGTFYSASVGPVLTTPTTTTPTKTTTTTPDTSTKTVRFYRCARTCTLLNTHGATSYKPQRADYGRYIKVVTTLTGAGSKAPTVTTRWIGPITAATAGDVTLGGTARVASVLSVKGSTRTTLARARIKRRTNRTLTIAVTRRGRTATSVWAYVIRNGTVVSCTRSHSLARPVTLSVPATRGETVKLVAVRA